LYIFTDSIAHNRSQRMASGIAILASDEWEEMQNEAVNTAKYCTWQASTTTATDTPLWPQRMRIASRQDVTHLNQPAKTVSAAITWRMRWVRYMVRMGETQNAYNLVEKPTLQWKQDIGRIMQGFLN